MVLYDIDAVCNSFASVTQSFSNPHPTHGLDTCNTHSIGGTDFVHCFAVKSCPLSYILHRAVQAGLGLECASIMEVSVCCTPSLYLSLFSISLTHTYIYTYAYAYQCSACLSLCNHR